MKKGFIYSIRLVVILLIGSLLTIVVYDLSHLSDMMNQVIYKLEDVVGFELASTFESNLTYGNPLEGSYIHESRYPYPTTEGLIEANLVHSNITVEASEGEEIEVLIQTKNPECFRIDVEDEGLVIHEKKQKSFGGFSFKGRQKSEVMIKVPRAFGQLELKTINGDVLVQSMEMDLVEAATVNGEVKLQQSQATEAILSTVNGAIYVSHSELIEALKMDLVNGSIIINEVIATAMMNHVVNGEIVISNLYGQAINASAVNADFEWEDVYVATIDINRLNGNIKWVNEDLNYQIQSIHISGLKKNDEIQANVSNISYN